MSSPRDPDKDLGLERLGDRDGRRPPRLGEFAVVADTAAAANLQAELQAVYQALNDAAFTAPGAAEWLAGLRRWLAALLAGKEQAPRRPPQDAIRQAS
jgi:hypothetical protein